MGEALRVVIDRLSIGTKIKLSFGLVVVLLLVVVIVNDLIARRGLGEMRAITSVHLPVAIQSTSANQQLLVMLAALRGYLVLGDANLREEFFTAQQAFEASLDAMRSAEQDHADNHGEGLREVEDLYQQWVALSRRLFVLHAHPKANFAARRALETRGGPRLATLISLTQVLLDEQGDRQPNLFNMLLMKEIAKLHTRLQGLVVALRSYVYSEDPTLWTVYQEALAEAEQALSALQWQMDSLSSEQRRALVTLDDTLGDLMPVVIELQERLSSGRAREDLYQLRTRLEPLGHELLSRLETIANEHERLLASNLQRSQERMRNGRDTVLAGGAMALALGILLAVLIARRVANPLAVLSQAAARIAEGELVARVQVRSQDELGQLAVAFNDMAARVQDMVLYLEERVAQRTKDLAQREYDLLLAKEDAEAASRSKSTFLATMSHELRTPLNGILGYAQILKRDRTLDTIQQEGVVVIEKSGNYLLTLINDILDIAKIESDTIELHPLDFHLGEFLGDIAELFQLRALQQGIAFHYEPLTPLPVGIRCDDKRLRQILINLLSNAVKFTVQGGVSFKVGCDDGQIRFLVEDTGSGIELEDLGRIFEPFQQSGDQSQRPEGTGLGLAITRRLVELMGGEISVDSQVGRGSVFSVILPLEVVPDLIRPGAEPAPVIVGYTGAVRRILVVDDRWENRAVLVNLLKPLGFEMIEAHNGEEGLGYVQEKPVDLVITDLVMPVLDGFEFARRLRRLPQRENLPVVAVSASVFDHHQAASLLAGCDAFLAKPIRADRLLETLQRLLDLQWCEDQAVHHRVNHSETQAATITNGNGDLDESQARSLQRWVMSGDVEGLQQELERLETTLGPGHSLLTQARELLENFQIDEIGELIAPYLTSDSTS